MSELTEDQKARREKALAEAESKGAKHIVNGGVSVIGLSAKQDAAGGVESVDVVLFEADPDAGATPIPGNGPVILSFTNPKDFAWMLNALARVGEALGIRPEPSSLFDLVEAGDGEAVEG
jgi:hypothetical protein